MKSLQIAFALLFTFTGLFAQRNVPRSIYREILEDTSVIFRLKTTGCFQNSPI
jgi:hypothetical protein